MTTRHHPADLRHRQHLIATLRGLRLTHGMTQQDIADDLYVTHGAISRLERKADNPQILTIQRYARALDHRVAMRLGGTPAVGGIDPGDDHATSNLLAELVATRHTLGLRQKDIADRLGITHSAVCDLETDPREPRLSTYQRYARALGTRLMCRIIPAPVVDMVKVDQVHAGRERFGNLTDMEQVALFRRYSTASATGLQERWKVSGARYRAVAALAEAA